ncbi:hypothetical protein FACS189490_01820 [Clostridia bacterium]|nr:hypothetical protein FACS189490_01820 [Clostridia bacterium]
MGLLEIFTKKQATKDTAKARLQLVLEQDRFNVSDDVMEQLKNELLRVISRYVDIDQDDLEVRVSQTGGELPVINAHIPIKKRR